MDTSSSVGSLSEKVRTSQPSLTKRGLTLQVKNDNTSSREKKVEKQETVPSSQTLQEHSVDINA
ncbi:hypothetical protein M1N16_01000 [Nitrospinaceae bacterium]|nr:hypothetical protein [Nitrospinaceae bacterium]